MNEQVQPERISNNNLVVFAGPLFDLILRLKSGIVQPSAELRPKVGMLLREFEERATRYRYRESIVQVAKFGLAAFIDETVLTANFPLREDWEKYPLQLEYFGEQLAGDKFFDKLEAMLRQINDTADAVEVYYVCMLLGFKGRYAVYEQEKLLNTIQRTADALVKTGRISKVELSPHWLAEDQPAPPEQKGLPRWAKVLAFGVPIFAIVLYLVMFLISTRFLQQAMDKIPL